MTDYKCDIRTARNSCANDVIDDMLHSCRHGRCPRRTCSCRIYTKWCSTFLSQFVVFTSSDSLCVFGFVSCYSSVLRSPLSVTHQMSGCHACHVTPSPMLFKP